MVHNNELLLLDISEFSGTRSMTLRPLVVFILVLGGPITEIMQIRWTIRNTLATWSSHSKKASIS
jgi:hypothetical protein